jgi:hypothetical protein
VDFVVLGFGLGALAVLIGLGVRDLGPLRRRVSRRGELAWSEVARRVAWGRACRAVGLLATLAGAGVCFVTLVALALGVSDSAGMIIVIVALLVALVLIGAWCILDRRRVKLSTTGVVHQLGEVLGGIRRRPVTAGPSSGAARRAARRATGSPAGSGRTKREAARSAGRPPTRATATPRPDPWHRSVAEAGYLDPEDRLEVAGSPPSARAEWPEPAPPRVDRHR